MTQISQMFRRKEMCALRACLLVGGALFATWVALPDMEQRPAPADEAQQALAQIVPAAATARHAAAADPAALPDEPEFHTFSICAIDPSAGQCGVAVTTRVTLVGRFVPWVRAGVGAVATQATTAVKYGNQGLDLLEQGTPPAEAIEKLLADDAHRELRQLGIIDMQGRTAAFTGQQNGVFAGSRQGKNYTVQGNLLIGRQVIDAVADRFQATDGTGMSLADRLIAALEAGQAAGGDKRKGLTQSAALLVADAENQGVAGDHIVETLHVAEHPEPVGELRRQYDTIHQRLGYRTFSIIRGRDVIELKRMLHALGLLWPDRPAFPGASEQPDLPVYTEEAADAVDRFRHEHGLPAPADRLGHQPGVVDAPLIEQLRAAYNESRRKQEAAAQATSEKKN
ncbi:MAG: DUF1028 domain-containing protein [Planctomycetia bacterium]|nr:DUF1028 domain-containing protein [Planctomycetia bacterium]